LQGICSEAQNFVCVSIDDVSLIKFKLRIM
jgi:hypothetical protein